MLPRQLTKQQIDRYWQFLKRFTALHDNGWMVIDPEGDPPTTRQTRGRSAQLAAYKSECFHLSAEKRKSPAAAQSGRSSGPDDDAQSILPEADV